MQTILRIIIWLSSSRPSKKAHQVYQPFLSLTMANRMAISCATRRCASSFAMENLIPTTTSSGSGRTRSRRPATPHAATSFPAPIAPYRFVIR